MTTQPRTLAGCSFVRGRSVLLALSLASIGTIGTAPSASASVVGVGVGAFGVGSTLTTFTGLVDGTQVNGLTVDGILFQYSLGSGHVVIDGGPGITNNIAPPNVVSVGSNAGILTMTLPVAVDTFGYGFAILATTQDPAATTISLFNGATPVGSLSYAGAPDPSFTGGFAGIQSTLLFNRVEVTFDNVGSAAFALDNVRTFNAVAAVPEPTSILLLGTGLVGLVARRRRRQ